MPANSIFTIAGGSPQSVGTGEVGVAFDTTDKVLKLYDGTTVHQIPGTAFVGAVTPKSGTSGTGANTFAAPFALYVDNQGVRYFNEGTLASPYWTPLAFDQRGLWGFQANFEVPGFLTLTEGTPNLYLASALGKPVAATLASTSPLGNNYRIHGNSAPDGDAGMTVVVSDQGTVATLTSGNENPDAVCLSFLSGTTPLFKPSVNGTMVTDIVVSQASAITNRSAFFGWLGSAADAITAPVTGAGTTISFANTFSDDIAGLAFSTGLTATDRWYFPYDKANTNASIATTATGVDTGITVAAAATYQRLRVEVDADGGCRAFINKALVSSVAAATLTTTTALSPIFVENALTTANTSATIKHFQAWGAKAAQ